MNKRLSYSAKETQGSILFLISMSSFRLGDQESFTNVDSPFYFSLDSIASNLIAGGMNCQVNFIL